MRKGQWVLGIGAVALIAVLYFGTKSASSEKPGSASVQTPKNISWEEIEQQAISGLAAEAKDSLSAINRSLEAKDTIERATSFRNLILFWVNHNHPAVAAYQIYRKAEANSSANAWSDAGDAFTDAFKSDPDSAISNKIITFALQSYEKVLELVPGDINTRIKIAEIYVQGTQDPMKGIGILKRINDSLPDNIPTLIALGRMSLQSGQYDKARERLGKVLQLDPENTEAMYFLAVTEAESGNSEKAIQLLELCKKLVRNPDFDKEIDTFIKDLKNKKV